MRAIATFLKQWALLIGGIAVSGAASLAFGGKFPWSAGLLVLLLVSVVVAVIVYMPVANHEMRSVANDALQQGKAVADKGLDLMRSVAESVEVTATYKEELRPNPSDVIEGVIFDDLIKLVREAKQSIVVVVKLDESNSRTEDNVRRKTFLSEIESKVGNRASDGFAYLRLYQGVSDIAAAVAGRRLRGESLRHVTHVLEIRQRLDGELRDGRKGVNPSTVSVMVTDKYLMDVSFMIVDERHLAIEIDSIDNSGALYAAGFLIIRDRAEQIVPHILAHVAILKDHAYPISIEDLGTSASAIRTPDAGGQIQQQDS